MIQKEENRYPAKLEELVEIFHSIPDRSARIEALISLADRFQPVPPNVATPPFPEEHRVKECESQAYVWAEPQPDQTLKFHFAVENPQGISAMATAVLLDETLSGVPLTEVSRVPSDVIYEIFGRELSMGKSMGLMGMISMVKHLARTQMDQSQNSNSSPES